VPIFKMPILETLVLEQLHQPQNFMLKVLELHQHYYLKTLKPMLLRLVQLEEVVVGQLKEP